MNPLVECDFPGKHGILGWLLPCYFPGFSALCCVSIIFKTVFLDWLKVTSGAYSCGPFLVADL